MTNRFPSNLLVNFYRKTMAHIATKATPADLSQPAVVVTPHQDDETLGCGGTIIRKRQVGARIKVIFVSDGSASHQHLMPSEQLKTIRQREALAATQHLGLTPDDVIFLRFKDGQLLNHQKAIASKLQTIFQREAPAQLFIPYHKEPPPDHIAVQQAALEALHACQLKTMIYEYPVWFWNHWPWTNPFSSIQTNTRHNLLLHAIQAGFGLRLLTDFNYAVSITEVLDIKKEALNQHQSQMSQLIEDERWLTLNDVAAGDWLECFFQKDEFFRSYYFSMTVKS